MQVILPGDSLPPHPSQPSASLILGPGLQSVHSTSSAPASSTTSTKGKAREEVEAVKSGLLGFQQADEKAEKWWVEGSSRRVSVNLGLGRLRLEVETIRFEPLRADNTLGSTFQYVAHPPEPVLGIILARHAEGYRVDIGSSQAASLDALAFEGASKRNKPDLKVNSTHATVR